MAASTIDPIRFEVVRNALTAITEEMAAALRRTAYSTNVKTRQDFSCAFFDADLRVVAQAFTQAVHLGSFVRLVPQAMRAYGVGRLKPGDMILVNDPYSGGTHLNDITLIAPVFVGEEGGQLSDPSATLRTGSQPSPKGRRGDGESLITNHESRLLGFVAALAHHVDVGGGAPASLGAFQEVYQEGVIIPPVRLVNGSEIDQDVFRLVLAQIRSKKETTGDFRAQIAAIHAGQRRLDELIRRLGVDDFVDYVTALLDYTETRTRAELERFPRGRFTAEGFLDSDGFTDRVVNLKVAVEVAAGGVRFDTTGSDPQRRAPVNSTFSQTFSACAYALRALMDKDLPINDGFYRFVQVHAPPGTVTHAAHPAPVVGGWETAVRVNDLIFKALSEALPEAVPAGTKAMQCQAGFGILDPKTGEYKCFYEAIAGGYGGRFRSDGPDAVQAHGQNTENAPVEETEAKHAIRIARYELIPDSDGAGKQRGGLGLRRDYQFTRLPGTFTILADREIAGPWGLFGGHDGQKARYLHIRDGQDRVLGSKTTVAMETGDTISFQTCGGGGYGRPEARDSQLVLRDVREGKVSLERARDVYRVAIDPVRWQVDEETTKQLRGG